MIQYELVNEVVDLNEVRDIDETERGILASILESFYIVSFILALYNIWQRLNVLWLNTELHNEIFQLSYTAKKMDGQYNKRIIFRNGLPT